MMRKILTDKNWTVIYETETTNHALGGVRGVVRQSKSGKSFAIQVVIDWVEPPSRPYPPHTHIVSAKVNPMTCPGWIAKQCIALMVSEAVHSLDLAHELAKESREETT